MAGMSAVRRQKSAPPSWEDRWSRYAFASLAAGLGSSAALAEGVEYSEITYTLSGAGVGSGSSTYEIDLDGDSVADFSFLYDAPGAVASTSQVIPGPFGNTSTFIHVSLPGGASVPGKILLNALNPDAYVLGNSYSSAPFSVALPSIFQSGSSARFFSQYSFGSGFSSSFFYIGSGMLQKTVLVGQEDALGALTDNGVAGAGNSPSFFGLVIKDSGSGPTAGFVGVNRRYDELVINFWGEVNDPTSAFVYASPVPEAGTVGGLAALALGAVGLREWRKRRRRMVVDESAEDIS
jgi:hypothetical protein